MAPRITPYEALLQPLETVAWPQIREEASHRGTNTLRRDEFVLLGTVGAALRDIIPDESPADATEQYAELLYQAYQYWHFGTRTYVLDPDVLERLVAPDYSIQGWILAAPPACYVQLPAQRVWARVSEDSPFEPVDGWFVAVDETRAAAHLRAMLVLGLRPDRPGISLASHQTEIDPASPARVADAPWRADAKPFDNAIPGGERRALHAITTTSELEALVLRAFHYLDRNPERLIAHAAQTGAEGDTALPYIEVRSA